MKLKNMKADNKAEFKVTKTDAICIIKQVDQLVCISTKLNELYKKIKILKTIT